MSQTIQPCRCEEPYPEIAVCKKNLACVPLLKTLYSGKESELTAITQYLFHSLVLNDQNPEVACALKGIAMEEMHHFEMLGELIVLLGGTPDYTTANRCCWWNGGFVNYRKDLCGILLTNLSGEVNAVDAYLRTASCIKDVKIAAVLRRIALDEARHAEILRELICKCRCRKA